LSCRVWDTQGEATSVDVTWYLHAEYVVWGFSMHSTI
jgi:hypothetical protein